MKEYDKSSQWLIQHHGDSILRLAGVDNIASWRALSPEQVQPRRIPDGLLEVTLHGEAEPNFYLVEIESRPERRKLETLAEDLMLVWLDRKVLPELVVVFLAQAARPSLPPRHMLLSRRGWSRLEASWQPVELWTLPAQDLLAANDVGLIPWVPLAKFDDPVEVVIEHCRERIDQQAPAAERANLLAVTQILMHLRYNDPGLFGILGGRKTMIDSPLIQEVLQEVAAERSHETITAVLEGRFGSVPPQIVNQLRTILDAQKLLELARHAGTCPTLQAFQALLNS